MYFSGLSPCDYTHARFWILSFPPLFGFQVVNALLLNFIFRDAKSLVKHLLVADVTKRYGCLRNGANDIKNHRWFKNLDWFKLGQKRLPVPFIP